MWQNWLLELFQSLSLHTAYCKLLFNAINVIKHNNRVFLAIKTLRNICKKTRRPGESLISTFSLQIPERTIERNSKRHSVRQNNKQSRTWVWLHNQGYVFGHWQFLSTFTWVVRPSELPRSRRKPRLFPRGKDNLRPPVMVTLYRFRRNDNL